MSKRWFLWGAKLVFDETVARNYDKWLETPKGRYMDQREKELILKLLMPRSGERLLDVGCGTGDHLVMFKNMGCLVTGIDPSPAMLTIAREKLGQASELYEGIAEDLPFSDNEFDVVTMITSLEFTQDPLQALSEAIRVCRGRIFLGVLNKCSLTAVCRRVKGLFSPSIYKSARFFHILELMGMIKGLLPHSRIQWGSVIFFPPLICLKANFIEERLPTRKNPFGAFLGISFPVTFTRHTVQDLIRTSYQIKQEGGRPVHGIVGKTVER